jgi:hypothetical protein
MAQDSKGSHNSPSHEVQVKGGQSSHSGSNKETKDSTTHKPSHEASVKGGERSHSGSKK